jgi:hypothetical protein
MPPHSCHFTQSKRSQFTIVSAQNFPAKYALPPLKIFPVKRELILTS